MNCSSAYYTEVFHDDVYRSTKCWAAQGVRDAGGDGECRVAADVHALPGGLQASSTPVVQLGQERDGYVLQRQLHAHHERKHVRDGESLHADVSHANGFPCHSGEDAASLRLRSLVLSFSLLLPTCKYMYIAE